MIDISNVRRIEKETYIFISTSDVDEVIWLLENAGARENVDFRTYPRHMISMKQVPVLQNISDEDRKNELEDMYGKKRAEVMMNIASVLVSHYNKNDLFKVLKPIIVDGKRDKDYHDYFWKENEKHQQGEWPVE